MIHLAMRHGLDLRPDRLPWALVLAFAIMLAAFQSPR
jgi:hypothetical protein